MKVFNNKGYTLIEVVVSVAILGILSIVYFSLFTNSTIQVIRSGNMGETMYAAQTGAEALMAGESSADSTSAASSIDIAFGSTTITVDGNVNTVEVDVPNDPAGKKAVLKLFIPDKD